MKISVITPTLDQAPFIEQTIRSVWEQGMPDLEHIIIDGGSTDGTLEILKRYPHLKWVSEKDRGIAEALNKGLRMAAGDVIGWINSDDMYLPGAFRTVERFFDGHPDAMVLVGRARVLDAYGRPLFDQQEPRPEGYTHRGMVRFWKNPTLPQPSVFFRRPALETAGLADESLPAYMDYDLFLRMSRLFVFHRTGEFLSAIHLHDRSGSVRDIASGRLHKKLLAISRKYWEQSDRLSFEWHRPRIAWAAYYDRFAFAVKARTGGRKPEKISWGLLWGLRRELLGYPPAAAVAGLKWLARRAFQAAGRGFAGGLERP